MGYRFRAVKSRPQAHLRVEDEGHRWRVMTHKYRGCIVVLLINKSVEPNEEQKVLINKQF
jgi:hypothetical protein